MKTYEAANIPKDRGMALLAVTALALVIAVLAVGLTRDTRLSARVTAQAVALTQAEQVAEAAELWAALMLAADRRGVARPVPGPGGLIAPDPGPPAGVLLSGRASGLDITVRAEAERGKVDLLTAPPAMMRRLLRATGIAQSGAIVDHVMARRRDGNAGLGWRIGGRPVNRLDEIAAALGMRATDLTALARVATVEGGLAVPDPLTAPEALFRALDLPEDTRRILIEQRSSASPAQRDPEPAVFTLLTEARGADGARARRVRMVEIGPDGALRWDALTE